MSGYTVFKTSYSSLPVEIPYDFLAPLSDPSTIKVEVIDFTKTPLPQYKNEFAAVLDDVLSKEECDQLLHMAEKSAGAHTEGNEVENNGWRPALVNAGRGEEAFIPDYRNSDRIIWDNEVIVKRLWDRVLQAEGMKDWLLKLEGKKYEDVIGTFRYRKGQRWHATEQGVNERMRFLKYGPDQFFGEHCDAAYQTPDGLQRSFFTIHLYLNDSAEALGLAPTDSEDVDKEWYEEPAEKNPSDNILRGGATTFHYRERRLDIHPKIGRILIFQHLRLSHSGDFVTSGTKYTMRSDLMYKLVGTDEEEKKHRGRK